jgi:hypothetical protein
LLIPAGLIKPLSAVPEVRARPPVYVRYFPKSGHWRALAGCPLCVKSGLMHCSK